MAKSSTTPRIAIPMPHSVDREYAERSVKQYEEAVRLAGGEPVRIELARAPLEARNQIESCDAVLLPGSRADVDPEKYHEARHPRTEEIDPMREAVDRMLLDDAFENRKPVLGICYGLQSLNVYRSGSLVQHIESPINHSAGRAVPNAHMVRIDRRSHLAEIVGMRDGEPIAVNSSHHQSANVAGVGLRVVAHSTSDGVIEALEGTATDHFVLAVQWHPERSVHDGAEVSGSAEKIFRAFIEAARVKRGSGMGGE
jgi:putative glutamine amidotransferase